MVPETDKNNNKKHKCECGSEFNQAPGLSRRKKTCNPNVAKDCTTSNNY